MSKVNEFGKGSAKSRNVGSSMEQRRVLLDEQILHLPAAVLGCLVLGWTTLRDLDLRLVEELLLCASQWVDNGWQASFWAMGHVKGKGLDMATNP